MPAAFRASDAALVERWRAGDESAREIMMERHERLVHGLARRFAAWGEPYDDLAQVAWIGFLKSLARFDAERAENLSTYCAPFIIGELRRYFRDRVGVVRVPRPVSDLRTRVIRATAELTADGVGPTIPLLAEHLEVSVDEILEALQSDRARSAVSLSVVAESGAEDRGVPSTEDGYDEVEDRLVVGGALAVLDDRDRLVLRLRFTDDLSQSQIAARIGVSQMQVSRILRRACERLRDELGDSYDHRASIGVPG
jgi:RNA polymerase sigma-B factor